MVFEHLILATPYLILCCPRKSLMLLRIQSYCVLPFHHWLRHTLAIRMWLGSLCLGNLNDVWKANPFVPLASLESPPGPNRESMRLGTVTGQSLLAPHVLEHFAVFGLVFQHSHRLPPSFIDFHPAGPSRSREGIRAEHIETTVERTWFLIFKDSFGSGIVSIRKSQSRLTHRRKTWQES